jgi:hypoxanthine phosphoribosyltransferase
MTEQEFIEANTPEWIESGIDRDNLEAIVQGGCASGAYMPAATYYKARATMAEHGDDVLEYIDDIVDSGNSLPAGLSWSGICCHYLSMAVELWAVRMIDHLETEYEEEEE